MPPFSRKNEGLTPQDCKREATTTVPSLIFRVVFSCYYIAHICICLSTTYRWDQGNAVAIGEEVIERACYPIDNNEVDTVLRDAEFFYHPLDGSPFFQLHKEWLSSFQPRTDSPKRHVSLTSTGIIGTIAFLLRKVPLVEELHIIGKDSQAIAWLHFSR